MEKNTKSKRIAKFRFTFEELPLEPGFDPRLPNKKQKAKPKVKLDRTSVTKVKASSLIARKLVINSSID